MWRPVAVRGKSTWGGRVAMTLAAHPLPFLPRLASDVQLTQTQTDW